MSTISPFHNAAAALLTSLDAMAGIGVTVRWKGDSVELRAVPGETPHEVFDGDVPVVVKSRDWMFPAAALDFGSGVIEPADGMEIDQTINSIKSVHRVTRFGDGSPWRWCDRGETRVRVHSRLVGTSVAVGPVVFPSVVLPVSSISTSAVDDLILYAVNVSGAAILSGQAVGLHPTLNGLTLADNDAGIQAIGFARSDAADAAEVSAQTDGVVTLADWSNALASGSLLTRDTDYWQSDTPGEITTTPPAAAFVQRVGRAASTTQMVLIMDDPIAL